MATFIDRLIQLPHREVLSDTHGSLTASEPGLPGLTNQCRRDRARKLTAYRAPLPPQDPALEWWSQPQRNEWMDRQ